MKFKILIMIPLILLHFYGGAQESLSLSQAIETGLKNNYDITIVDKNVEMAENSNNQGEAGRWPSLQFSLSQNNRASEQLVTATPYEPRGVGINNALTPGLNLNWTLFDGFNVNISKKKLENLQLQSEGNASIVISNTIQAIIFGYYLSSLERERLEVFHNSLKLSNDRYRQMKLKKEYGSANTTDLLLEEGNYLTDSISYINQELAYRAAIRVLNELLAVEDLEKEYVFTDSIEVSTREFNMTDLQSRMMENNVDLKTKYLAQSIVKHDLNLAKSGRYPTISLGASGFSNRVRSDNSQAEFFDFTSGGFQKLPEDKQIAYTTNVSYTLNFSLTYNLFNGRKINTAIKNAKVREDIGNLEIERMTLSLRKDLLSNFDNYNIRNRIYKINDRKLEVAALNLKISGDKFKLGAINSIDYRVVQVNYLSAALAELNARYGLLESKIALMRLTGGILEVYQ